MHGVDVVDIYETMDVLLQLVVIAYYSSLSEVIGNTVRAGVELQTSETSGIHDTIAVVKEQRSQWTTRDTRLFQNIGPALPSLVQILMLAQ